jgi:hypothetical protein
VGCAEWAELATIPLGAIHPRPEATMKYGARNDFKAKMKSIQRVDLMSLVKYEIDLCDEAVAGQLR